MDHDAKRGFQATPDELAGRLEAAEEELKARAAEIEQLRRSLEAQQRMLTRVDASFAWQLVQRYWRARDRVLARSTLLRALYERGVAGLRRVALSRLPRVRPAPADAAAYGRWVERHALADEELDRRRAEAARRGGPSFTLYLLVGAVDASRLRGCLASLARQTWTRWEAVAFLRPDGLAAEGLLREAAAAEPRLRIRLEGDPQPSAGDLVALVGAGDTLAPTALEEVARALDPDVDLVYTDEDRLLASGERIDPFFKPEWSPDLLLSMDYVGHLAVFRRELVDAAEGWAALEAGASYDLALRASERARRIAHVADVLYHVGGAAPAAAGGPAPGGRDDDGRRALEAAVARRGLAARVEATGPGPYRVRYRIAGEPLVSIVMPTRDKLDVLRRCVDSVEARSTWGARELILVDNGSTDPAAVAYLDAARSRHRVLRDPRPFNWSALNDAGAAEARGSFLLFMNNDMEVVTPDWIEALLEHAQRAEVGAVGAKLLYPDRTIQHAGIVLGIGSVAGHAFRDLPDEAAGYRRLKDAVRDVSAVTGACLMVRREVFEAVGGFDAALPVAYNDVDFCLKLRAQGLRVVYTPHAVLLHHESSTRRALHPPADEELVKARWYAALERDPYYSPHLSREREDFAVAE